MPRFPDISPYAHAVSARVYSTLAERAKAKNDVVYPLHIGDTYRDPIEAARAERQLSSEHSGLHRYAPVQGEPELIKAFLEFVARRHDVSLDRACVQVMSGATPGLNVVTQVLLEPGDEVLLPSPFWPLSRGVIATKGAIPVQVPFFTRLDEPDFDAEALLEEGSELPRVRVEIAAIHALRDEVDEAMEWLERAYDAGWRGHVLSRDPTFTSLRLDPRFRELVQRIDRDVATMRARSADLKSIAAQMD